MTRIGIILLLAVIAGIAMTGPVAAQPKVTIAGLVDNITSYTHNISQTDLNPARNSDHEWYARTRIRPDIIAEVGTTKFVLGVEIDATYGQTANQDTSVCLGAACPAAVGTAQRFGTSHGLDLNTDVQGVIEIKWAYTEFDVPLIPVPTRMRLGAQPFETQYKTAVLATGDFAGVHVKSQLTPMVKTNFTYAQMEESSTGPTDNFIRGDDFAIIASVEVTPFKGLDLRPIFSYANFIGPTSGSSRQNRAGLGNVAAVFPTCPGTTGPGTGGCVAGGGVNGSAIEDRFTVGLDARWRFGPFSFDPTVFYQFGSRDQVSQIGSLTSAPGVMTTLKRDAWYADFRGGWQAGPLLIEAVGIYTSGNTARDRIDLNRSRLKYYEPLDTDGSYFATWSEMMGGGAVDYFNSFRANSASLRPTISIGYDKYGLIVGGLRASYAITPAFTVRAGTHARWTAEEVDTASTVANGTGLTPRCAAAAVDRGTCIDQGTASYLGSELVVGFQWRFAPNIALDFAAAYFFVGNALSSHLTTNIATGVIRDGRNPQDMQTIATRVRYTW
jgi:hypothetical protein